MNKSSTPRMTDRHYDDLARVIRRLGGIPSDAQLSTMSAMLRRGASVEEVVHLQRDGGQPHTDRKKKLSTLKRPCVACPWRKKSSAQDIPNFDMELAERLSDTCPDQQGMGPDPSSRLFACHQSKEGDELVCAGWLASVGDAHPLIRLAVLQDRLSPESLRPRKNWPSLHSTYDEMMEKLRRTWKDSDE
ncbi:DUF6283 family protein [Herbaspirillum huttiense]|uniref:DUF6283 family protein n=1 Tax=Herbaspirillum huttiense TaxID=863372 RepID=UPI0039B0A1BD